jgi:hypothetical protein
VKAGQDTETAPIGNIMRYVTHVCIKLPPLVIGGVGGQLPDCTNELIGLRSSF